MFLVVIKCCIVVLNSCPPQNHWNKPVSRAGRTTSTRECTKKLFFQSKPTAFFLVFCCSRWRRRCPHLNCAPNEEPSFLFYLDIFPWFSKAWKPACSQWYKSRINLEAQASYLKIPFNKFVLNLTQHRISIIRLKVYAALSIFQRERRRWLQFD